MRDTDRVILKELRAIEWEYKNLVDGLENGTRKISRRTNGGQFVNVSADELVKYRARLAGASKAVADFIALCGPE